MTTKPTGQNKRTLSVDDAIRSLDQIVKDRIYGCSCDAYAGIDCGHEVIAALQAVQATLGPALRGLEQRLQRLEQRR